MREAAGRKPVIAIANGMSASAGYALASGATKIIAAPSGMTGSIGVALLHLDLSRALDKEGVTPTLIFEGARKTDGNPVEPLTDAALSTLRDEVHRYYELFLETVAMGRGRRTPARAARDTEGRIYVGREAIDARLADDVGTFEDVLGDLIRRAGRQGERQAQSPPPADAKARRGAMDPLFDDQAPTVEATLQPMPPMIGMRQEDFDRAISGSARGRRRRPGGALQGHRRRCAGQGQGGFRPAACLRGPTACRPMRSAQCAN